MSMKRRISHLLALVAIGRDAALAFTNPPSTTCGSAAAAIGLSNAMPAAALSISTTMDNDVVREFYDDGDDDAELALLLPGQTLRIRIGDVSASRKAWKKRRRNSSPVLVPCSVLGMNREWMVRWNVMTLLHAIGEENPASEGAVSATAGRIGRAYRQRLGGDLREHAEALGYDSVESLLRALFDERINAEYGIRVLVEPKHGNLVLATSLTRRQARGLSSSAGMVQFRPGHDLPEDNEKMIHTGLASVRVPSSIGKKMPKFAIEPLGAALRVSPYDEAAQLYKEGDELNAFVYSYDLQGDNESPLLVLSADDPRGKRGSASSASGGAGGTFGTSTRVFRRRNLMGNGSLTEDATIERELNDLAAGDGPFDATVVAVSSHSHAAFVDCGVGRKRGKRYGGGVAKVLGMLRFEDVVVAEEESNDTELEGEDSGIKAGDEIQVYVKAVSPQSGRFMVTLDPSVKDKRPKDMKREKQADKRKERLEKRISHEDIESLIGNVYGGVVKAKSKTGDWYYVQACVEDGETGEECDVSLPVGVAALADGAEEGSSYSAGDRVRVRLDGVDERRGQLALTLLD